MMMVVTGLRPALHGSTPWTLNIVGKDDRTLSLLVPTLRGPGIVAGDLVAQVTETTTTVTIEVQQRIDFPGPESTYTGFPTTVNVRLRTAMGTRTLLAAEIDLELRDWFGTSWESASVDGYRFGEQTYRPT